MATADDEIAIKSSQLWQYLDHLAGSSPAEYKAYIQKVQQEAIESSKASRRRILEPCFAYRIDLETPVVQGRRLSQSHSTDPPARWPATGKHSTDVPSRLMLDSANESRSVQPRRYYINVGRSRLIDPPKSKSDSVSVVMSNARIGIDDDDMPFWAYDVIVHPKVFGYYRDDAKYQSDLKSLIFDCVHETHGIKLPPGEATTIENMYKGPFAWTETGQPKEFKPQPDASLDTDPLATLAPSDLLKQLRAAEHIANAPPIPAISDAPSNRIQERAVISTPGIIVATDSLTTPAVNRVPESVSLGGDHAASKTSHQQPHYDLYDSETVWKARVHLPDQACADNLQVDWKPERCIAISSGPNELLRLGIPGDTPLGQPVCKFIKKTRCLSVTVQKGK